MKTKLIADYKRASINEDGNMEIVFELKSKQYEVYARSLKKGEYAVILDTVKKGRTLDQNSLMWKLIQDICSNENAPTDDTWDMYCELLRTAKARYTYLSVLKEGLDDLAQAHGVRAVQPLGSETRENGKEFVNVRLFLGTSQMSTLEMGKVIDCALSYAEKLGIDTTYYIDRGIR